MGDERDDAQRDDVFRGALVGQASCGEVRAHGQAIPSMIYCELLREAMTPHHRLQSYYGYAFESYCTSSIPDRREVAEQNGQRHAEGWGGDVDTNVQWCSVVKTKLGNDRLVIGGEVDCVRSACFPSKAYEVIEHPAGKYTGKPDTFVELKTSLNIRGPQDEAKFEKYVLIAKLYGALYPTVAT